MNPERSEWISHRLDALRRNIPAGFRDAQLQPGPAADWCAALAAGTPSNLLLHGTIGTGKTWTGYGCWLHLVVLGWVGAFRVTSEQDYLAALLPEGERRNADLALTADVLLLDDLGVATSSPWAQSRLDGLMDYRWQHQLPVIVTTNLAPPALAKHLGERATSRLRHRLVDVPFTGPDRRRG